MLSAKKTFFFTLIVFLLVSCAQAPKELAPLQAGFRYSSYGPPYNPGPEYWASTGEQMAAKFKNATPSALWIVGIINDDGVYLNFDCTAKDPKIRCSFADINEKTLTLFDEKGYQVWLQVEPGNANMDELIEIILNKYKHHPSIVGFGVDVEWYKSTNGPQGEPITDELAKDWVTAIRKINPNYYLFLKHWDAEWMPPTYRDGIVFIDDSQQFESFEQLIDEFSAWGKKFEPAPVGFQYGYPADKKWWSKLQDPPAEIGQAVLERAPNTIGLFWVDFTLFDIFPPQ
ncbi:MAG: hypothetical protein IT311_09445 [Anaerolineales bacterium]|nr:hypothetical protein [Anaerolineales bacterium]MCZ2123614.1 hypothetical protein [Anaerolineales bacterium]